VYGPEYYAVAFINNRFYLYVEEYQIMRTRETFVSFDIANFYTVWEQATYTPSYGPTAIVNFQFE
jgi:hypothetical protein